MTAPMPPCPAWCAEHVELEADGPNPAFAIHRTAPTPVHATEDQAEVSVLCERMDGPGQPGVPQPFLRLSGVDYGLTVEQAYELADQANRAAMTAEFPGEQPAEVTGGRERPDGAS